MRRLAILATICVPCLAHAQDRWQKTTTSTTGDWFVDRQSTIRQGDTVSAWLKLVFAKPDTMSDGKWVRDMMTYTSFECERRTSRTVADSYTDLDGKVARTHEYPDARMEPILPESVFEAIAASICSKKIRAGRETKH